MSLDDFLQQLRSNPESIEFDAVMSLIESLYDFSPAAFQNGTIHNAAGENSGSCKLFAFARQHGLSEAETLACFGRYYREDVLLHPDAGSHMNIRNFMASGRDGISFDANPLTARSIYAAGHDSSTG
jgi:hypothetical protein